MGRKGYIKLFRKFEEWEWYKNPDTKSVFLHLLIKAEWRDAPRYGLDIKRGQMITTESMLMDELGMTRQRVRTALAHLVSTNEITKAATNIKTNGRTSRMTLITLEKYEIYQSENHRAAKAAARQAASNATGVQPSINQPAIIKKKIKNINNNINNIRAHARRDLPTVDKNEQAFDFIGWLKTLPADKRREAQQLRLAGRHSWEEIARAIGKGGGDEG